MGWPEGTGVQAQDGTGRAKGRALPSLTSQPGSAYRLLNANKINCIRPDAFQDLQNLSLLSLYDNRIQSLAKGTFTSLRAIQTL